MSQSDTRAQRQRKQDECRLSIQRNNAYFSYVSATLANADNECPRTHNPTNLLVPTNQERTLFCRYRMEAEIQMMATQPEGHFLIQPYCRQY